MSKISTQSQVVINFPTVCLLRHFEGDDITAINKGLSELIRNLEADSGSEHRKTSTQGGFHTKTDFLDRSDSVIQRFRNEILIPGVKDYMANYYNLKMVRQRDITPEKLQVQGWGNIMRKGEWNAPHNHTATNNRLSAVYYIQVPECERPEGALQFENPNPISVQHGDYGNIKFHPGAGDLILFPCYQVHFSHPFHSEGERILIASDIKVEDEFNFSGENNFISLDIGGR